VKLISSYVYGLFGPARHAVLVGPFGPARHENRPMGRAWAVGQARSPGQPGTVARRAKLGPARSSLARPRARAGPGGPFAHLYRRCALAWTFPSAGATQSAGAVSSTPRTVASGKNHPSTGARTWSVGHQLLPAPLHACSCSCVAWDVVICCLMLSHRF